ncbi:extracellular solute-binding protein [Niallia sp. 03133]|uniref:extracellular solute-binding protein n=1 Tax=Niallia sp. 03133 TaxID=3458060 RepID=UPI004044AE9C
MLWRVVSFVLVLAWMAGCSNSAMISNPDKVQKLHHSKKHIITFWHTYNDKETELLEQKLIPAFEKEYPNIEVHSVNLAFNNELKTSLMARTFSNRGPDVARINISWVPELSQKGFLEPLNALPDFEDIHSRFQSNLMNAGLHNTIYYSLPLNIYTKAAIFNLELLKRAGYSTPPSTMDEVLTLARRNHFSIGIGSLNTRDSLAYLYSLGGTLTDKNFHKASGYLNGDETIHAVKQLTSLYKEKLIDLPGDILGTEENWNRMKAGNMLMTDDGPWFYGFLSGAELHQALKLTLPVPFPQMSHPAALVTGENLIMMKGSKHRTEAWIFMKWMTGIKAQVLMAKTGLMPTNLEAAKMLKEPRNSYLFAYKEATDLAFLLPPVKNWNKIDGVYTEYLTKIFSGELSVEDGLDRAAAEIDVLLAES